MAELAKDILPSREKLPAQRGLWQTEAGQLNEVVHLWVYKDLNERAAARQDGASRSRLAGVSRQVAPLLASMQSTVLVPTPASPMK